MLHVPTMIAGIERLETHLSAVDMQARSRILFVDDSRLDRELVRHALEEEHGGFAVVEAGSREEFESLLEDGAYDLVLSDFNILGFDGLEVIDFVQQKRPNVPVVIVTGSGTEAVAVEAMKRGAADYVIKSPERIRELASTIESALDQKQKALNRQQAVGALRQSEEHFRALIENALDIIMVIDTEGKIDYVSPSTERLLGYPPASLMDHNIFDFIHNEDAVSFERSFEMVFAEVGAEVSSNFRFRHQDGASRMLEAVAKSLQDENGAIKGVINARDVTERRWAEEALRESEQQYRALIEQSVDAIYVLQDEHYVLVNKAWERLFEYSKAEALSPLFDLMKLVAPESREYISERRERRKAGQSIEPVYEFRGLRRDGRMLDIEASVARILWQGRPAIQGVFRDVTERKQAEEALRQYAERLEVLRAIDQALLSAQSSTRIAVATVQHIQNLIPCTCAYVFLVDAEDEGEMHIVAQAGNAARFPGHTRFSVSEFGATRALREGEIQILLDLRTEARNSRMLQVCADAGIKSMMRVPLHMQEELLGILALGSHMPQAFTLDHLNITREVAEQLSVAMHSTRLFEEVSAARQRLEHLSRRLVEVQEQERRHLALELHDEIGQVLTALNFTLDFSETSFEPADREQLGRARELVDLLTSQVRNLSLELRPSMLDDLGLLPALSWYFGRYKAQTKVEVVFIPNNLEGRRFRAEVETAAYRIVQEALTNVARYAGVGEVFVRVWTKGKGLHIEVKDEGKGFDPRQVRRGRPSAGLSGMQERAALVGGKLDLESTPGSGVRIRAVLPAE